MARRPDPELRHWWRDLLESFDVDTECSSVAEFCRLHDVSTASFYNWRRRLSAEGELRPVSFDTPAFVPIELTQHSADQQLVQVHLPGGVRIEVPTDARTLLLELITHVTATSQETSP
jgi:hypothetical protein